MNLPRRKLGSTELNVSVLGLGTVKFGRNTNNKYPQQFTIPEDKEVIELLALAKDLNINLIDTAPAYGASEHRLGKLLHKQRHDWIIVSKAGEQYIDQQSVHDYSYAALLHSIKNSLQQLQTDYLDVLLIHSDGNDEHLINDLEVFATLAAAKQQGLIRYFGMSSKTVNGGLLTVQHADVAMVMCNPIYHDEIPVIEHAAKLHKGILVKKAFASGHIDKVASEDPIQTCMDFIFKNAGVNSIVLGTINPDHLKQNVQCAINCTVT